MFSVLDRGRFGSGSPSAAAASCPVPAAVEFAVVLAAGAGAAAAPRFDRSGGGGGSTFPRVPAVGAGGGFTPALACGVEAGGGSTLPVCAPVGLVPGAFADADAAAAGAEEAVGVGAGMGRTLGCRGGPTGGGSTLPPRASASCAMMSSFTCSYFSLGLALLRFLTRLLHYAISLSILSFSLGLARRAFTTPPARAARGCSPRTTSSTT